MPNTPPQAEDPARVADTLEHFNSWRRGGDEVVEQPHPTEIGAAIDAAVAILRRPSPPLAVEAAQDAVIVGALFDFMGFLTTHETRWKFSAYDDASPAVEALRQFAAKRSLSLDDPNISGWRPCPAPVVQAGEPYGMF